MRGVLDGGERESGGNLHRGPLGPHRDLGVDPERLRAPAHAQALHRGFPHSSPAHEVRYVDAEELVRARLGGARVEVDGPAVGAVLERPETTELQISVELAPRLREEEFDVLLRINGLRQEHERARGVDVLDLVVQPEGDLHPPGAEPEPVGEPVVQVEPVDLRVVVS